MSEMALGAATSGNGEGDPPVDTPSYITGCVYQPIQTTGLDGKKVLKLLPVSKPLNNLKNLVQSSVVSHDVKRNVSLSVHDYVKTSFKNTITSPAAKISELKTVAANRLILLKPLNQQEKVNVTFVVKQNPITSTVSGIQSSYSADRSSLQKSVAPVCSDTSTAIVKIENTPLSMKPPVLPSGHHLQIPAHAKVKTLPVSVLPPVIQEKILATVPASNASGKGEIINAPTVTFVSPVNTVKMPDSKSLETKYPKPVEEVSSSLIPATPQKVNNNSAVEVSTSASMEDKTNPIKWVVHENPRSSTSYLVPVKSSNKVASKLLKTLADMKNTKSNSTSILPVCPSSFYESHAKMPSTKDSSLVMCNGKVYLLAKKEANILSTLKPSKQESTNVRKQTSESISSVTDNTMTNQVINIVLSKNKRIASNVKEPTFSDNSIPYLESEVSKDFKAESTPSASPHCSLQIRSISQHEASSSRSVSVGINVAQKYVTKENTYDTAQKDLSSKAAADPTLPTLVHRAVKEEEQQVKITSGMKHIQEQQKKQYLQLRKKFGLFKEERVYLRRASSVPSKSTEASVFSKSVQMNDIDNLLSMPMKSESEKEETIKKQGEKMNIKRKTKSIPVLENPKKRKKDVTTMQDSECNNSYSAMENLNNSCTRDLSEQEQSTSFLQCSHKVSNPWVHNNNSVLNSTSNCHENENETALSEGFFKKDLFPFSPPDLEETIKDEKITRLKLLLREREAALEAIRKKMHQC
ncbi:ligand-dependent nuclear receptor-interacting factor 1 [Protobothrops mucrosquamatus]|uniref:ligand-dependent nuclear receptor-interacting factor 1 n=1 Tax=Protobothrops mucrosquamatus TaxID=103944 RepID=UPI000775902F|nr:ligand-dependent nuclear receptor-interacting factor 1 [Protobothrops mucrosquamatus]